MEFFLRKSGRYWSVLQLVAIVACNQGKVSSERVQGCVGSQLSFRCPPVMVIQITGVVLGDSLCTRASCCIKDDDCTYTANANHRMDVRRRCDYKRNCTVGVIQEEIPCGYWWDRWSNSDFERITYNCIDYARNDTMNNSSYEESTENNNNHDIESDFKLNIARGCVGSQLSVKCEKMKVIEVMHVVLGYSNDNGAVCNISYNNCIRNASANHTMDVHHRCDNRSSCTIDVPQEKINCGTFGSLSNNDFELIAYICLNDSRNILTPTPETSAPASAPASNSQALTAVIVIICLIILLAIAVLVVVMYRRKKKRPDKSSNVVKKSDMETDANEAICMNDSLGSNSIKNTDSSASIFKNDNSKEVKKSLNCGAKNFENQTSDYCELEGVATGRIQSDGDYEELNRGRNYEPLILYEQLQTPLSGSIDKS